MTPPVACTIVANNYLAYARSFTRSFLDCHPEGKVCVLIVDRPLSGHDYGSEPFAVTFADRLGIPEFLHFAFRYSILELSTAVKPYYLLHLHRTLGIERLCYFDPDILVLGDLREVYERLGHVDAVLTPHVTAPLEDAYAPSELDILKSGTYNLGFLGLSYNERTLSFLDWWARRLYRECLHDVANGLFVDQRWMDLAPAFLPRVEILRDPGYNAAYWNLAHRRVTRRDDGWRIEGVPLRFFHFSGYDLQQPEQISKFQNRFSFADRPDAQPLFDLYRARLEQHGHESLRQSPYGYGYFDNGAVVPGVARRGLQQADPEAKRWRDPFSTTGADCFFEWLRQPWGSGPPIPRLAFMLWERREDLQRAFARPREEDGAAFARWFAGTAEAVELIGLDPTNTRQLASSRTQDRAAEMAPRNRALSNVVSLRESVRVVGSEPLAPDEIQWLTADAGDEPWRRPRVPWLAMEMRRERPDLQRAYPDPLGADREALALWYTTFGRHEYRLPDALVFPVVRTLPWRRRAWVHGWWRRAPREREANARPETVGPAAGNSFTLRGHAGPQAASVSLSPPPPEGLNVIGMITAATGVGEACRGTMAALARVGLPGALWIVDEPNGDGPPAVTERTHQGLPFDVILYHVNADTIETIQSSLPTSLLIGRYRIGYWFWELAHFPLAFAGAFRHVDEVWAPSRFCFEAYRQISPVDVRWVPPSVPPTEAVPSSRAALGVDPDAFLFFFSFDARSIPARKNPIGLLTAFTHVARQSRVPVHLLLKVNHADADPTSVENLRIRSAGLPVTLRTGTLPRADVNGLLAACDAYVSLHRSEGLGLTLIEAMYLGKPVIATGYGGVTDFFDEETGYPVRYQLTALQEPHGPYPVGAVWAEPDVEHAASLMLALANDPRGAVPRIRAARQKVGALYAPDVAGERIRRELARIRRHDA